jgi:hypothetical protein
MSTTPFTYSLQKEVGRLGSDNYKAVWDISATASLSQDVRSQFADDPTNGFKVKAVHIVKPVEGGTGYYLHCRYYVDGLKDTSQRYTISIGDSTYATRLFATFSDIKDDLYEKFNQNSVSITQVRYEATPQRAPELEALLYREYPSGVLVSSDNNSYVYDV